MTDIYINPTTGDLELVNGSLRLCETVEELVRQRIWITLFTNRGSWAFNTNFGVPYLKNENSSVSILGKTLLGDIDAEIKQAILSVPQVIGLLSYESKKVGEKVQISFSVESEEGDIINIEISV